MKMEEFEPGAQGAHAPFGSATDSSVGVDFFCKIFVGSLVLWEYVSNFVTATT